MEGRGGIQYLEDDKGLDFLIPLVMFMHRTCLKAVCCFFTRYFKDTEYVTKNISTTVQHEMTLKSFLEKVNEEGKNGKGKKGKKNKGKLQQPQQPPGSQQQWLRQQQQPPASRQQQSQQRTQPLSSSLPHSSIVQQQHSQQYQHFQQPLVSFHNSKHQHHQHWGRSYSQHQQKQQRQSPQGYSSSQVDRRNQLSQSTSQHQQQRRQSPQHSSRLQQNQNCADQLNQSTSQHQQGAQRHPTVQATNSRVDRRPSDIQNIDDNAEILNSVTVGDLMQQGAACQKLEKLDINFVLNAVLNTVIDFPLGPELVEAILKMKDVRKVVVHPKYHFTKEDFDKNLATLEEAVGVLYRELTLDEGELQKSVKVCREEAKSGNKVLLILNQLVLEVHKKYIPPDSSFVPPDITLLQVSDKEVLKDLNKFIEGQQDHQNLIVLSGEHREEKARLLESLASTFKDHTKFKLVVHVNERDRWHYNHLLNRTKSTSEHSALTLQDEVFACLTQLAPDTVHRFSLDYVKTAVSYCQKDILFLVNWNLNTLSHVKSEVQEGTWVFPYEGNEPSLVDWKVLRVELYTQAQVLRMIDTHPNKDILKDRYNSFDNKDILSSLDMIQIFWEVCGYVSATTDFDVVERYYAQKCCWGDIHTGEQDEEMVRLSEAAFSSICETGFISKDINIRQCVLESFLCPVDGKRWRFKHSNVRDFMAAKYVIANPSQACQKWVKGNVVALFKRVFKFACFLWDRSHSEREYLPHMEAFLRIFLCAPKKEKKTSCSGREAQVDKNELSNQMVNMGKEECDSKHRDHFDSWDFLLELDEACSGKKKVLKRLMSILSDIPCWCFSAADCLGVDKKLTRLEKVLKLATLDKDDPLTINLKSNTNVKIITEFWNKLRRMEAMYGCVNIIVAIEEGEDSTQTLRNEIEDFFKTVTDTQVPLHIKRYKGPLFPSGVSKFLKCMCMQNLEILEVRVNDMLSLQEVMLCGAKEMHVLVSLESSEMSNFTPSIEFPLEVSVYMVIEYFHNIQLLLDGFRGCQHLHSLSIRDLYISPDFKLSLSAFSQLEILNIRFEPETVDRRSLAPEEEMMQVEVEGEEANEDRLPRSSWLSYVLQHLTLPEQLKRLLLRNIDIFSDSSQNLINELFQKYDVKRLVILDTRLSLPGARKILCSQTEEVEVMEEEEDHGGREILMKRESVEALDMREKAAKRIRLSEEECDAMELNQPGGKEVVITADGRLCFDCCCSPCMCVSRVGHEDSCSTYRSLAELINNMYIHGVQCYSYSFNHRTARMNKCGDLSVECIMRGLTDADVQEMDSRSCLFQFFHPLSLAKAVVMEGTAVSPLGAAGVAEHLRKIKGTKTIEPFALTVETSWHPSDSTSLQGLKDFLGTADYLTELHYKCGCSPQCFHIEKTYGGEIKDLAYGS